ncbi:MAG: TSUP family transporter, partial [Acetobacteraceae bacterium]
IHNAVATASGLGVPITIAATLGYAIACWSHLSVLPPLSIGFVSLIGLVVMAPVSTLTAPYGARLSHALTRRQLEIAFACFFLIVAARFIAALF